jgi:hypothetical protein
MSDIWKEAFPYAMVFILGAAGGSIAGYEVGKMVEAKNHN